MTHQMLIPGRGTVGNLTVPEKRLSMDQVGISVGVLGFFGCYKGRLGARPWAGGRVERTALRVIIFQPNLKLYCFEKIALLLIIGVFQEFLDVGTHSGCRHFVSKNAGKGVFTEEDEIGAGTKMDAYRL